MASSRFPPLPTISSSSSAESLHPSHKLRFPFHFKTLPHLLVARSADSGAGMSTSNAAGEKKLEGKAEAKSSLSVGEKKLGTKGKVAAPTFEHPGWIQGRWDLKKFQKGGKTDWDAIIDAEARRRKCLEDNPEASRNDESIPFSTSIIPWWAWAKRYYLPEPKLLNGHAAIFGFFMAYFVDSLTGIGLVDQKENFVCKSLLFFLVARVLLVRKNEGIGKVKNFIEETISYDKQWKATWQDDSLRNDKNE